MVDALVGVGVSATIVCVLTFLFRLEEARGVRFFGNFRAHMDFYVLKVKHFLHTRVRGKTRFIVKQVFHYFVHTLLTSTIHFLAQAERRLKTLVTSNKTIAKRSERERTTRNKLEEIALHKMEMALTEEEKRRYKDTALHS